MYKRKNKKNKKTLARNLPSSGVILSRVGWKKKNTKKRYHLCEPPPTRRHLRRRRVRPCRFTLVKMCL